MQITQKHPELEITPTATNVERELQQMDTALVALTSCEANDIVAKSRKTPSELQKRYDPTTGGRKRNFLRTVISLGRYSLLELQAGIERWESYVSRYEKKLKDMLDDELKLAGLGHWCLGNWRNT